MTVSGNLEKVYQYVILNQRRSREGIYHGFGWHGRGGDVHNYAYSTFSSRVTVLARM